jgi:hypothetical protein
MSCKTTTAADVHQTPVRLLFYHRCMDYATEMRRAESSDGSRCSIYYNAATKQEGLSRPRRLMRDRLENNMDATQATHPLAACTALPGPLDWRFLPACAEHVSRAAKGATDARGHYCERNHSTSPLPLLHAAKQPGRRRESLAPSSSLPEPCGQETVEGKRAGRRHMIDPSISHQATPPFPLFSCSLPCRSCVRRSASVSHRILLLQSSKNWYRLKSNDMFLFSPV